MDRERISVINVQKDILMMEPIVSNVKVAASSAQIPRLVTAVKPQNTSTLMGHATEAAVVPVPQSSQALEPSDIVLQSAPLDNT